MEDLFYFTRCEVSLQLIADAAESAGYRISYRPLTHGAILNVKHGDGYWHCSELEIGYPGFDEPCRERIDRFGPKSQFMFSFSATTAGELSQLLKLILEQYGGWVGCDDFMEVVYDVSDIHRLPTAETITRAAKNLR